MKASIKNLQTVGFVPVQYPGSLRAAVEKASKSWEAFCDLHEEVKKNIPYSNNTDGVGYEFKDGSGPNADYKENFDITTQGVSWLQKYSKELNNNIVLQFIQDAVSLVEIMKPLILQFAKDVEREFNVEDFQNEVAGSSDAFFVRFIHYFKSQEFGMEVCAAHPDQSGFTLHLFESEQGLQCMLYSGEWIDMPVSPGETVIIPAMQLQLRSKGKLRALCHRVIATPKTAREGRFAAVCFVQLKNTPKYNKEVHGRLQEKKAGFNYDMDQKTFTNLFK